MRVWRGDYVMRLATLVPFLLVSQLVAHGYHHDGPARLLLAALLGLVAAIGGWATLTAWRHYHHRHPSESAS